MRLLELVILNGQTDYWSTGSCGTGIQSMSRRLLPCIIAVHGVAKPTRVMPICWHIYYGLRIANADR